MSRSAISINIDCFGTNTVAIDVIYKYVKDNFNFKLSNIISELNLNKPIYKQTACYGHFGNNDFSWEKIKY